MNVFSSCYMICLTIGSKYTIDLKHFISTYNDEMKILNIYESLVTITIAVDFGGVHVQ
jgi:hypothetical protein